MGSKGYAAILILALSAGAAETQAASPATGGPGDAVHGQVLFKQKCSICHQPDKGGKNGVGPALYGAYGHAAAHSEGYKYSPALTASGIVWTPDKLDVWVQKPQSLVPNAKMVLPSPVTAPQDRADLIAFLKTQSDATEATAKPKMKAKKG